MAQLATNAGDDLNFTDGAVPSAARMPRFALMMSYWATCSAMFWLVISATLALDYGARNTIVALLLSVVTYSLINTVIVRFATAEGLSVALFSKVLFGAVGADLAALILFATATYYAIFEGSVIAQAFHTALGVPIVAAYLVVVVYSCVLVFGSIQTWLDKLNGVLLPFYLAGLVAAVTIAIDRYGFSSAWLALGPSGGAPAHGWLSAYIFYMGAWVMMMFTLDYARFGRPQDVGFHTALTFGWGFYVFTLLGNGLVGIFLVGTVPMSGALSELSVVMVLLKLMGLAGLLFVWVSQTRMNTANFYVASLNLQALAHRLGLTQVSRPLCVLVVGLIVLIVMQGDIFSVLLQALAYQGVLIEAWVAIALVYMLSSHAPGVFPGRAPLGRQAPAVSRGGMLSWLVATVIGIAMLNARASVAACSAPATALIAAVLYAASLCLPDPGRLAKA